MNKPINASGLLKQLSIGGVGEEAGIELGGGSPGFVVFIAHKKPIGFIHKPIGQYL